MSVIVPHYADLRRLDICLAALTRQTYPADALEIIVADNGSPEGEAAVRAVITGRARLVTVAERGAGPARNGGAAAATGAVLAFTDSDCVPDDGWLAAGVSAVAAGVVVGGRVDVHIAAPGRPTAVEAFEQVFAFDNARYVGSLGFSVTANLFCTRGDFLKVGDFRNGVSEDVEWCRRARAAGLRLDYCDAAAVGHPARRTWPELIAKWRRIQAESRELAGYGWRADLRWAARALLLPLSAVAHTPKALLSPRLRRWTDRLGAVVVLHRLRWWRLAEALRRRVGKGAAR